MTEQPEHKRIEAMEYCANVNNQTSSLRRIIMTKIESLELELAARKMVEGTGLDWWQVLRYDYMGVKGGLNNPPRIYLYQLSLLELALGIIEGKPVWDGDEAYWTDPQGRGHQLTVTSGCDLTAPGWSWNQQAPKTVMVELTVEDAKWMASAFNSPNPGHPSNIATACRKALENLK